MSGRTCCCSSEDCRINGCLAERNARENSRPWGESPNEIEIPSGFPFPEKTPAKIPGWGTPGAWQCPGCGVWHAPHSNQCGCNSSRFPVTCGTS